MASWFQARINEARIIAASGVAALLLACSTPVPIDAPVRTQAASASPVPVEASLPARANDSPPEPEPPQREQSRWLPAAWSELPGWNADAVIHAWPALLRSCTKPAPGWAAACDSARKLADPDEAKVRDWLQRTLRPWRIAALDGRDTGLATGYFEPLVEAARTRSARFAVPLHALPAERAAQPDRAWYTRAEIDRLPAARAALQGREIAWVADPLDALLLQVQGSGRLVFNQADGSKRVVRLAYAGHNGQPYQSVGRWLVEQRAFTLEQASWPAIKQWARDNPKRVSEMLHANPRVVFFREEPLPDPSVGALGAQGVPLTPGRSIAVDPRATPYGTPVWIATTEPQAWQREPPPPRPLQRLVLAQDTGSAITGAVRADYFWGWGEGVEDRAGRMKQPLKMWALWPRG